MSASIRRRRSATEGRRSAWNARREAANAVSSSSIAESSTRDDDECGVLIGDMRSEFFTQRDAYRAGLIGKAAEAARLRNRREGADDGATVG